jgi:hypothetical protein
LAEFDARMRTFFLEVYHRRECAETKEDADGSLGGEWFPAADADRLKEAGLEQVQDHSNGE